MKLTALLVKNAKGGKHPLKPDEDYTNRDYKLFDGEGLFLLVKKNGNKHWRLKYRFLGKEKLLALGAYPLLSLQGAREAKLEAKRLIVGGIDPVAHKKSSKADAVRNVQNTFHIIAMEWYENRKDIWKRRYAQEVLKRLEEDIFPHLGKMPIKDIEPPLLLEVIRKIERRGALELAKRQLQKCGEIFRYAIATGRATRDPSNDIKEALMARKNERKLFKESGEKIENGLFDFTFEKDINNLEKNFALYLADNDAVTWWHRMVARQDYALQGWQRNKIYPDFIACANQNRLFVMETKGLQLKGNDDTEYKTRLFDLLTDYYHQPFDVGTLGLQADNSTEVSLHMLMEDNWEECVAGYIQSSNPY